MVRNADPAKHRDFMSNSAEGGIPIEKSRDNLMEKWVYCAEVNGFEFQFADIGQVLVCKHYFEKKTLLSTMEKNRNPHEHYWHPWHCKPPKGMIKNKSRLRAVKP